MEFIISLLIFGTISVGSIIQSEQTQEPITVQTPVIKESLFLTMERTPCFGKCPSYKITLFNTGRIMYEGRDFAEIQGNHSAQLSLNQVKEIEQKIDELKIYEMNDKYDAKITDIPSCLLYLNHNGQKKKIYDRYGAPDELKQFEKFIDKLVFSSEFTKLEESE